MLLLAASVPPALADPPVNPGELPPVGARNVQGQNDAQQDMALAIDNVCPRLRDRVNAGMAGPRETLLRFSCGAMIQEGEAVVNGQSPLSADQFNGVVQSINGEEQLGVESQIQEIGGVQADNISARLSALRAGAGGGLSVAGLSVDVGDQVLALDDRDDLAILPAQFEDGFLSRLGIFVTGGLKIGDKDATGQAEGFDFDSEGITVGADYRLSDQLAFGAAVGYSRFNADFDDSIDSPSGQELDSDSVLLSFFGTYFPTDRLFVDGIATIGWSFYDSERRIVLPDAIDFRQPDDTVVQVGPIDDTTSGDFDAFQYGFAGDIGYEIPVAGATVTPLARLQYLRAEIDGYSEDPVDGGLELQFSDQEVDSLTTNLGVEAAYPISTGFGIIQPSVRAEYVHEFIDDPDGVFIQYASDPTNLSRFQASQEDVDQDYAVVGAALTSTFAGGWAAFVDYTAVVALSDFNIHAINLGFRKEF